MRRRGAQDYHLVSIQDMFKIDAYSEPYHPGEDCIERCQV